MTSKQPHLLGKTALVTGAAKRVGRETALALARAGMDIAFTFNSSPDEADDLAHRIAALGRRALPIRADLARPDAADRIHRSLRRHSRNLHALINNASIFPPSPLAKLTPAQFHQNMAVNTLAPLLLIQKLAPLLAAHADTRLPHTLGRVVNFIDAHVLGNPLRGFVAYNASKAALLEITRTAAVELAPKITVNAIAPGVIAWAESYTPAQRRRYLKRVPLARPGTPEDAAAAVLFLIRDAHYMTGETLRLDGGRSLT